MLTCAPRRAVEEVEVGVQRTAVTAETDRQLARHAVEVEGLVALLARGPAHLGARAGRYEDLGLDARGQHLGRLDRAGRQDAVFDEEDVRVEAGAFVPGTDLGHDAGQPDRLVVRRELPVADHDVVELEILVGRDRHPVRERGGVVGAQHPPHGALTSMFAGVRERRCRCVFGR